MNPAPDPEPTPVEVLVADVAVLVRRVQSMIPLVDDLRDSRQASRPFIPPATKRAMGEQYVRDRRARREAQAAGFPAGTGASPVPGNMPGWALAVEITHTLRHHIARLVRHHHKTSGTTAGLTTLFGPIPGIEATNRQLVGYLYELVWTIDRTSLARSVESDMSHLLHAGALLLDGEDRTDIDGACPHCGNRTLIVYISSGVIRCERPRDPDGTRPTCHCLHAGCPCRDDPRFVHSWIRDTKRFSRNSWESLMTQLRHGGT